MGKFLDIKFVPAKDCFLHVGPANIVDMQCRPYQLKDEEGSKLFGISSCFATASPSLRENEVGISSRFAEVLGMKDVKRVQLCEILKAVPNTEQLIFTASEADYSILFMNSAKVEYILLDQLRVVGKGQKIVVWISPRLSITLTAENLTPSTEIGLLTNETELHILPETEVGPFTEQRRKSVAVEKDDEKQNQAVFRLLFSKEAHPTPHVAKIHPAVRPAFLFTTVNIIGTDRSARLQLLESPDVEPAVDTLSSLPVVHVDRRAFPPSEGVFDGCKVTLEPLEVVRHNEFVVHASEQVGVHEVKDGLRQMTEMLRKELLLVNQMIVSVDNRRLRFELKMPHTILSSTSIEGCNISVIKDENPQPEPQVQNNLLPEDSEVIFSSWTPLLEKLRLNLITNMRTNSMLPIVVLKGKSGCGVEKFLQHFIRLLTTTLKVHDFTLDCKAFKGKTIETLKNKLNDIFLEGAKHDPCILVFENLDQFFPPQSTDLHESPESSYRQAVLQIIWKLSRSFSVQHKCFVVATMSNDSDIKLWEDKLQPFEVLLVPDLSPSDKVQLLRHKIEKLGLSWSDELDSTSAQVVEICSYQDICDIAARAIFDKLKSKKHWDTSTVTKDDLISARNYLTSQSLKEFNLLSVNDSSQQENLVDCWARVGGLPQVKQMLTEMIFWPFMYSNLFSTNPLKLQKGALLYGMPGTGKTLVATELAKSSGMNLIHIKGPELLNKFIGASEEAVRNLFQKASAAKPCILFFDEIDSLAPRRGRDTTGVSDRVVNQLLTSLDGVDSPAEAGVWVLAASSRPDLIDRALLRPGRFDTMLHCNLPNKEERKQILEILSGSLNLAEDVDFENLASVTEGYCGADIQALLQTAQLTALEEFIDVFSDDLTSVDQDDVALEINLKHFQEGLSKTRPSLSVEDKKRYEFIYREYEQSLQPVGRGQRTKPKQRTVLA